MRKRAALRAARERRLARAAACPRGVVLMWVACVSLITGCTCRDAPEAKATPERTSERAEPAHDPASPHEDEPAHEALPTRVTLAEEVVRDAKLQTAPVTREVLPVTLALPGEVVADPDKSARLSSPIPGRIEEVRFQEGRAVRRGDVLAVIRVPDLGKLRSAQAATRARANAARVNAARLKELLAQQLTTEQTYLDAVASADALEVEARAATEQLGALGLSAQRGRPSSLALRAPISGTVVSRNAVVGQPVAADEVLCDIVDLSEVWFLGRVFEKDLGQLKPRAVAEVQLNAYPAHRFAGTVEYIGRRVDPVARTVTARVRLSNRDDLLRLGLFGTAYASTSEAHARAPTLVVPRSALTDVGGKRVVFVKQPDAHFEVHEVVLGASAAGKVEVLSGLRDGEQVVVEGVFTLKSAVLKRTFAEDEH